MKLEKFVKNKKQKKIIIGTIVGLIVLIGGITLYRTFALYEEKKEFNVLRGRVPNFGDYDIKLAFTIDGEKQSGVAFPTKEDKYAVKSVDCGDATALWNSDLWGLVNINSNGQETVKCTINFMTSYNTVTYMVNGQTYQENVEKNATCLSPWTFTPTLPNDTTLLGWSSSKSSTSVLETYNMGDNPVTLYGVYKYNDKSVSPSGSVDCSKYESASFRASGTVTAGNMHCDWGFQVCDTTYFAAHANSYQTVSVPSSFSVKFTKTSGISTISLMATPYSPTQNETGCTAINASANSATVIGRKFVG